MSRPARRRLLGALTCAALPVLLTAGCSGPPGLDQRNEDHGSSSSRDRAPSLAAVKFTTLPDPCETVSGETIDATVPKAKARKGQNLGTSDANSQGTCLWNGVTTKGDDYQFRALSVSLKRYDSAQTLGPGDERAAAYMRHQLREVIDDHSKAEDREITGLGDEATALSYQTARKDAEGDSADYREERIVIRVANAVITVDYQGAGLVGSETPGADTIRRNAEQAAKDAAAALS